MIAHYRLVPGTESSVIYLSLFHNITKINEYKLVEIVEIGLCENAFLTAVLLKLSRQ